MTVVTVEQTNINDVAVIESPVGDSTTESSSKEHDEEVKKICHRIVAALSEEEKEIAAKASYKYFKATVVASSNNNSDDKAKPTTVMRDTNAMKMARRHLVAENGDENLALEKMKKTIEWRKNTIQIDDLRLCFSTLEDCNDNEEKKKKKEEMYANMRTGLDEMMEDVKISIHGYDKRGCAIAQFHMDKYTNFDPTWYNAFHFYMLERTIAVTERSTDDKYEKIVVVFDYSQYTYKNTIPIKNVKRFLFDLRDHYPERTERIFLCDTPFIFRAFWTIIKPFIDPDTKSKVVFVNGTKQKQDIIGKYINHDQPIPFVFPEQEDMKPFDKTKFLYHTPFDHIL